MFQVIRIKNFSVAINDLNHNRVLWLTLCILIKSLIFNFFFTKFLIIFYSMPVVLIFIITLMRFDFFLETSQYIFVVNDLKIILIKIILNERVWILFLFLFFLLFLMLFDFMMPIFFLHLTYNYKISVNRSGFKRVVEACLPFVDFLELSLIFIHFLYFNLIFIATSLHYLITSTSIQIMSPSEINFKY